LSSLLRPQKKVKWRPDSNRAASKNGEKMTGCAGDNEEVPDKMAVAEAFHHEK
jgi:hypothetical protein